MLVLRRRKHESVVLGDDVTLTVEEICGGNGQRIYGATVRLGFQSPRYVSIYRSELRNKGSGVTHKGRTTRPAQPRAGKLVEISDAQVRLRIQLPRKIPVCCNGTPTVELDSEETVDGASHTPKAVHHVTCHKEDRIEICHNITITALNFHRFVFLGDR